MIDTVRQADVGSLTPPAKGPRALFFKPHSHYQPVAEQAVITKIKHDKLKSQTPMLDSIKRVTDSTLFQGADLGMDSAYLASSVRVYSYDATNQADPGAFSLSEQLGVGAAFLFILGLAFTRFAYKENKQATRRKQDEVLALFNKISDELDAGDNQSFIQKVQQLTEQINAKRIKTLEFYRQAANLVKTLNEKKSDDNLAKLKALITTYEQAEHQRQQRERRCKKSYSYFRDCLSGVKNGRHAVMNMMFLAEGFNRLSAEHLLKVAAYSNPYAIATGVLLMLVLIARRRINDGREKLLKNNAIYTQYLAADFDASQFNERDQAKLTSFLEPKSVTQVNEYFANNFTLYKKTGYALAAFDAVTDASYLFGCTLGLGMLVMSSIPTAGAPLIALAVGMGLYFTLSLFAKVYTEFKDQIEVEVSQYDAELAAYEKLAETLQADIKNLEVDVKLNAKKAELDRVRRAISETKIKRNTALFSNLKELKRTSRMTWLLIRAGICAKNATGAINGLRDFIGLSAFALALVLPFTVTYGVALMAKEITKHDKAVIACDATRKTFTHHIKGSLARCCFWEQPTNFACRNSTSANESMRDSEGEYGLAARTCQPLTPA